MSENVLNNFTYDELVVGQSASFDKTLTQNDINLFGYMSGDTNPAHFDADYAKDTVFKKVIAHGMWSGSLISAVLGTQLPGPGTIYLNQNLSFRRPIYVGDQITVTVKVLEKLNKNKVTLECNCVNQNGEVVTTGTAEVIAPTSKVTFSSPSLEKVSVVQV